MPKTLPAAVADAPESDPPTFTADAPPTPSTMREVLLLQLVESPLNPRTHFDEARLTALTATVREYGVIEPLIVRQVEELLRFPERAAQTWPLYEIVAGARRYRAASRAELHTVPCIVRPLTDIQALEIMVIENEHRDDVDALDEAMGFKTLLGFAPGQFSAATIAARIFKSEKYVWDRLKLLDLVPQGQDLLRSGFISAGHAILLARLTPEQQRKAIDPTDRGGLFQHGDADTQASLFEAQLPPPAVGPTRRPIAESYAGLKAVSVRELDAWISDHIRFDVTQQAAAAPLEFGETAKRVEEAQLKPGRGRKVVAITHAYRCPDPARTEERTFGRDSWKLADGSDKKSPACEFSVLGVVAAGPARGRAYDVCVNKDKCTVHWKAEVQAREKRERAKAKAQPSAGGKTTSGAGATKPKQDSQAKAREAALAAFTAALPALRAAFVSAFRKLPWRAILEKTLKDGLEYITEFEYTAAAKLFSPIKSADDAIRALAFIGISGHLMEHPSDDDVEQLTREGKRWGVDVAAIVAKATSVQTSAASEPAGKKKVTAKKKRAA